MLLHNQVCNATKIPDVWQNWNHTQHWTAAMFIWADHPEVRMLSAVWNPCVGPITVLVDMCLSLEPAPLFLMDAFCMIWIVQSFQNVVQYSKKCSLNGSVCKTANQNKDHNENLLHRNSHSSKYRWSEIWSLTKILLHLRQSSKSREISSKIKVTTSRYWHLVQSLQIRESKISCKTRGQTDSQALNYCIDAQQTFPLSPEMHQSAVWYGLSRVVVSKENGKEIGKWRAKKQEMSHCMRLKMRQDSFSSPILVGKWLSGAATVVRSAHSSVVARQQVGTHWAKSEKERRETVGISKISIPERARSQEQGNRAHKTN